MEEGSGISLYILLAAIMFGLFAGATAIFGEEVGAFVGGLVETVKDREPNEGGGTVEEEDEPEPEPESTGYKGSKQKLALTDDEIEAIVARIGYEPSKPLARLMLKNKLTYDELENIIAVGTGEPLVQEGGRHLKDWMNNEPFWYPQVAGETVQSLEPITNYTNELANVLKNERNQTAAQKELNEFREYSMNYPVGSYERAYYDKTIEYLGHKHGISVNGSGVIIGHWGT